jgi:hypothetical protein
VRHLRLTQALFRRALLVAACCTAVLLGASPGPAAAQTTDALLDTLQHTGVLYFWNEANPANGMVKDRSTPGSVSSIAATGFGLSAITVGVDRGWLDRNAARARTLTTLQTFWNGPQGNGVNGFIGYQGLYYHWLDMNTATRTWDSELSTIDTALLFAGIIDAKRYWSGGLADEVQIRALADSITWHADWNFMRNGNPGILMGWKPGGGGFSGFNQWLGYNEAMIMYLIALGSPTHAVPATAWNTWVSGYHWGTYYGYSYITFAPLFGHQYSHCWVDFRGIQDPYDVFRNIDYFENSRRATLAQHEYCKANPSGWVAYNDSLWGITASDDPNGYAAHGAPPPQSENGTLAPTAGISSLPFTPEISIPLIRNLWNAWRGTLWGPYGFKDAFNPTFGWVDTDYLGIDQGPIVLMIENYRTGAIWTRMMGDEMIQTGLSRAQFQPSPSTGVEPGPGASGVALSGVIPNPAREQTTIQFRLASAGFARLEVFDARGRRVAEPVAGEQAAGEHLVPLATDGFAPGLYWIRLSTPHGVATSRFARVR